MKTVTITTLSVAALTVTFMAGGSTAFAASSARTTAAASPTVATFVAHDEGQGPTETAAEANAQVNLLSDYAGCIRPFFFADTQLSDGTWQSNITANCTLFK